MRGNHEHTVSLWDARFKHVFFYLILNVAFIFFITGAVATFRAQKSVLSSNIQAVTSRISPSTLQQIVGENIPYIQESLYIPKKEKNWLTFFLPIITNINLCDPRTFLGELPMFSLFDTEITAASEDVDFTSIPIESPPPPEIEKEILRGFVDDNSTLSKDNSLSQVFIYHTHYWESYFPELQLPQTKIRKANNAVSSTRNMQNVGRYLASTLEQNGVGVTVSKKPKTGWDQAYSHSKDLVLSAMKRNSNLKYFIDLHRDDRRRKDTTIRINGKPYARLAFIIGKESRYYSQNKKISEFLCTEINKQEKGLCKAVFTKQRTAKTNGEYNQSLSPRSMLIEVGGVDNTFQEAFRSMEVLAKVLIKKIHSGFSG